jgi:carboxyl-terminal processing protease
MFHPFSISMRTVFVIALIFIVHFQSFSQSKQSIFTIDDAKIILKTIKADIKKHYFNPAYNGIDLDQRFQFAETKLKDAQDPGQMLTIVAQVLLDFQDSHLFYIPPTRATIVNYGFEMVVIGDGVYVSEVAVNSDAAVKGLRAGDRILMINNIVVMRDNLYTLQYLLRVLQPQRELLIKVNNIEGKELVLKTESQFLKKSIEQSTDLFSIQRRADEANENAAFVKYELEDQALIWKVPTFLIDKSTLLKTSEHLKKFPSVILDLRDNGGGYLESCLTLISLFFDKEISVAENKERNKSKKLIALPSKKAFTGKLLVLINAQSASASEIFSRVIQIEKRGIVIGDRSAGAVMTSQSFFHTLGMDIQMHYGVSITVADTIMQDGKSLEKTGVIPDKYKLPSPMDLFNKRDIALAYALELSGIKISPEEAAKLLTKKH